jgi:hypothetical protein
MSTVGGIYLLSNEQDMMYTIQTHRKPNKSLKIKVEDIKYIQTINLKHKDTNIYIPIIDTIHTTIGVSEKTEKINLLTLSKEKIVIKDTQYIRYIFWQLLAIKGNLCICKRLWQETVGWAPYDESTVTNKDIALFDDGKQKMMIYSGLRIDNPSGIAILHLINARYNINLTHDELLNYIDQNKDIEYQKKLFDFILDKEAALENNIKANALK